MHERFGSVHTHSDIHIFFPDPTSQTEFQEKVCACTCTCYYKMGCDNASLHVCLGGQATNVYMYMYMYVILILSFDVTVLV